MITHQKQPTKRSCGQTCLAMLLGMDARDVMAELGWSRGTSPKRLAPYLLRKGFIVADRLKPIRTKPVPPVCLVKVSFPARKGSKSNFRGSGHWMLWAEGRFWDPLNEKIVHWDDVNQKLGWTPTSYLDLTQRVGSDLAA